MATRTKRVLGAIAAAWAAIFFLGAGFRALASCPGFGSPFTDLGSTGFCAQIAEAYYTGLSNGTSATTYSPSANVPREQMAAFVTRTLDQSLIRGSRRAALGQWWNTTPHFDQSLGLTTVGTSPQLIQSDGTDVWVANFGGTVSRVRGSDGKLLDTWSGMSQAVGVLAAMNRIFVTTETNPGNLFEIDPTQAGTTVLPVTSGIGGSPQEIAFDGDKIWTANFDGSMSIIVPGTWAVTNVSTGFSTPTGVLFDGTHIWMTDRGDDTIKKLNANGSIALSVGVGASPNFPVFDGHNIWVPNAAGNSLTVVRASDGLVLKTFSAGNGDLNGLSSPETAAFDGQRILVTNGNGGVSLFNATSLSAIGTFTTAGVVVPYGACSDGASFWVSFETSNKIGKF